MRLDDEANETDSEVRERYTYGQEHSGAESKREECPHWNENEEHPPVGF